MSGADERSTHVEGKAFEDYFTLLLVDGTKSCFERDILRDCREALWKAWLLRAEEYDRRMHG